MKFKGVVVGVASGFALVKAPEQVDISRTLPFGKCVLHIYYMFELDIYPSLVQIRHSIIKIMSMRSTEMPKGRLKKL
jgi:hypothetical protein